MKRTIVLAAALLALAASNANAVFFASPSRNIGCLLDKGFVRCDIGTRDWSPPPKPRSCPVDWGQGVSVGKRGRARFVCAGDTVKDPRARILHYGRSMTRGRFTCTSRQSGLTCRNRQTGRGFTLAKERYRFF